MVRKLPRNARTASSRPVIHGERIFIAYLCSSVSQRASAIRIGNELCRSLVEPHLSFIYLLTWHPPLDNPHFQSS